MGLWQRIRRPRSPQSYDAPALARIMEELAIYTAPYISQGSLQPVNQTALLSSVTGAAAIATRAIADRVAGLEFEVIARRRVAAGTVEDEVLDDHPLKLMLDNPSEWHSVRQMKWVIAHHLVTVGEAYLAKIINGGTRRPEKLQLLAPDRIKPIGDGRILTGYELVTAQGQRVERFKPDEICRIWNPDPTALFAARGTLGPQGRLADMLEFAEQHLRSFYESDATPQVVLEAASSDSSAPNDPGLLQRFEATWIKAYHGRRGVKRGVPPFLAPGWAAKVLDASSTLVGTRSLMEYARDQILMAYGVPRSILGDVVDANRAAAETNQFVFDRHTVLPITEVIADAMTRDLASLYPQQRGIKILVRFEEFVSDDKDFALAAEAQDLALKVRSINEVRAERGDDPVDWGDEPVGSFADAPYRPNEEKRGMGADVAGAFGEPMPETDDEGEDEDTEEEMPRTRIRSQVDAEWGRFVKREQQFVPQAAARMKGIFDRQQRRTLVRLKAFAPRSRINVADLFTPSEWRSLFEIRVDPVRASAFIASGNEAIAAIVAAGFAVPRFIFTDAMQRYLAVEGARLVQHTGETTQKLIAEQLTQAAQAGEGIESIAKRIESVFDVRRSHARTIARTEMLKSTQTAQVEGFKQSGVVEKKRWNTSRDDAVREEHTATEGQTVLLNQPFVLGNGEMADKPGVGYQGQELTVGQAVNCRCFVTPVLEAA